MHAPPRRIRVLVANEPRSYREAVAGVLGELRPDVEVIAADPAGLDGGVMRLAPDVVICSRVTGAVRERVPVWVELYIDHGPRSVVSVRGERSTVEDIELIDLLAAVDQAERAAEPG